MRLSPAVRLSEYFMPTLRETPSEAEIVSHRLMLRAGMIRQESAGIYSWLPMGYRVLRKIEQVVRDEMDRIGCHEVLMPTIQSAELWRKSGRYDDYGKEMLRITDRHDRDMLFGPTNEEMITDIFAEHAKSYKDVPRMLYHIQWKFRDEVRPRFGVMRGREFLMKDAYSFDLTPEDGRISYNKQFVAYLRLYARMGLQAIPMAADTGPIGGDMSHEFIILAETGESQVWCNSDLLELDLLNADIDHRDPAQMSDVIGKVTSYYAATDEQHDEAKYQAEVPEDKRLSARGIEVGHIFFFGTKYSEPMNAKLQTKDGESVPVQMGSYGVGVSRLAGAIIEACHDDNGIVWPEAVAPFKVGLINLRVGDAACDAACEDLFAKLQAAGVDVMYDDRDERAGVKFADMDLIGLPWQIVVGPKGVAAGVVELKSRKTGVKEELSPEAALARLAG
ncbi:proline--tRNA ligase [Rhodospirillaceae bacterium KN72]|uniref:Proline--tRNA ligase n=1 Tax=Pacificispira spongiicola TaxID=2729598 RepID=A0A7Y0DYK0_9PROT|nr:proline--tRNA ligase [Pacificispira spongiicola]NMM43962.1 proline--tRNA ligase [Pacificispira spongiicola]